MRKKLFLLLFLAFCACIQSICGQDVAISGYSVDNSLDWQEQILQQVDVESLGDAAYSELLDELSELVVWSDTADLSALAGSRIKQRIIWSSNRCLSQRAGYTQPTPERQAANKAYLGDPWHHSLRYRLQYGSHWQAGFNVEKDAGEAWRKEFPGFDSWHAYLRYRPSRRFGRLTPSSGFYPRIADAVIGHYRLRMGCGLIINQGFSLGKQYFSQQLLQQRTNVLSPFASNAESQFMQGIAADLRLGPHLTLLPYFSVLQIDGTLSAHNILTALQTDGDHRTKTEASHRNAAWQWISGARLGWRGEWFDMGLHASYTHLQYDYIRNNIYYNSHYFRGHQLTNVAFDYTARAFGGLVRGEVAVDDGGSLANITALQYHLSDYWNTSLLYRYFDGDYHQLHASTLCESSGMQGEQGLTLNIEGQLSRRWQVQGMFDYFHFSQPQFGVRDSTSQGFEAALRAYYSQRHVSLSLNYRLKHKSDYYRHSLDGILTLQPMHGLTCRTQARTRLYNKKDGATVSNSLGYAFSQSLAWSSDIFPNCPFSIEGQVCYFHSDDYDSRLYLTERTILYGFGLPMLYGEGLRYSITGTTKLGPRISMDLKWAVSNYANRHSIGSGLQEIMSNNQHDLWLQLRLAL